jgi:hypothetical protein
MQRLLLALFLILFISCKKTEVSPSTPSLEGTLGPDLAHIPAGLPKRMSFGTEGDISQKEQYIEEADYQYQYLAGDIFSNGWATWNSPTGEFARAFLTQVNLLGKMPVFTYYNIVPAKKRFEDPAFTNLNDAEVMNKYFDDFKLLLQICKNYGKPVIIHYEPDLFGYTQMFKNDASKSTIKVALSNHADVQNFTNDAKGLAQAIVSMRNKYAPNVLLGWHASQWATGHDVIKGKHNPEELGIETADYYASLNAPFDIIFSEFSDRDAGYDQFVNGKPNSVWSVHPSSTNGNVSDYDRFKRFLTALNRKTEKKIILWQIPIGNSLTNTCNNTPGHFKDNKAEYFLQPMLESGNVDNLNAYGDAGVIALLFGRGAEDCTSFMDKKADGITGANETADDDGGYLRKGVKAYYNRGPVVLP